VFYRLAPSVLENKLPRGFFHFFKEKHLGWLWLSLV
jgi:hypothetical protein